MSAPAAPSPHPGTNPTATRRGTVAPSCAVLAVSTANRQTMPTIASVVDQLRAVFGPVQVIFASEGGKELGKAPDPGVIAYPPHVPHHKRKARTEGRSTPAARTSHGQPDREVTP